MVQMLANGKSILAIFRFEKEPQLCARAVKIHMPKEVDLKEQRRRRESSNRTSNQNTLRYQKPKVVTLPPNIIC